MACIAVRQRNPAGIATGDLDFRRVHERIDEVRIGDNDAVSDRNEIDRAPCAPPATGPVANPPLGAPRSAKSRKMFMAPSSQTSAQPSMELVRMLMVTSQAGITAVREI